MKKTVLEEKDFLNPEEAIVYFKLSRRKFYKLLTDGKKKEFMAMYGSRRLIIRTEFEKYLQKHPEIRRREPKWQEDRD